MTARYNLVAWYEFGVDPSFLNRYFISTGDHNWTGYSDADLDNLLTEAVSQTDAERAAQPLQSGAAHDHGAGADPADPRLRQPERQHARRLRGLTYDAYGWFPLLNNVTVKNG